MRLNQILNHPLPYLLFNTAIGGQQAMRRLRDEVIQPQAGQHILDIGCGPGHFSRLFSTCDYTGIDHSAEYIATARTHYGTHARFECVEAETYQPAEGQYDTCLAMGVLHHLDDAQARATFAMAHRALKPGGRFITLDGCFTANQPATHRWLLEQDRGNHVRHRTAYEKLATSVFTQTRSELRTNLLRIPYTHLIMVCTK